MLYRHRLKLLDGIWDLPRAPETYPVGWHHSTRRLPPTSYYFYCKVCGRVWFSSIVMPLTFRHCYIERKCPRHGLGALWTPSTYGLNQSLPRELLERELQIALNDPCKWKICFVQ